MPLLERAASPHLEGLDMPQADESMFSGEYGRRSARRNRTLLDMDRELEFAMGAWEGKKIKLSVSDALVQGLLIGLSGLPGGSIPGTIRDAKAKSGEAVIRASYHHAKYSISIAKTKLTGYRGMDPALQLLLSQIWIILQTISEATGVPATAPHWSD